MFRKIIESIKEHFETKRAMKAMALLIMNQYSDLLTAEKEAKETEKEAYESMKVFGESFSVDDLRGLLDNVAKIVSDPKLTTDYYKQVSAQAHAERMAEMKAEK